MFVLCNFQYKGQIKVKNRSTFPQDLYFCNLYSLTVQGKLELLLTCCYVRWGGKSNKASDTNHFL